MLNISKLGINKLIDSFRPFSSEQTSQRFFYRIIGLALKLIVSITAIYFIVSRIQRAESELSFVGFFGEIIAAPQFPLVLFASLILTTLNWSMEVIKWKILISTQFEVKWKTALKGVLSGVTFGVFSPNRLGEFVGRVLALAPDRRISGSLLSFVNGLAQTLATFSFGVFGLVYFVQYFGYNVFGGFGTLAIQLTISSSLVLAIMLYFRVDLLTSLFQRIRFLKAYHSYFIVFSELPNSILHRIYQLSLLRFITFILQYVLVFYLILDSPEWMAIIGSSVLTLFSTTLVPFLPIPDLLLRESIALSYFDLFNFDLYLVSIAVFCVWIVNVALPALIGAVVLFTYKIFRRWS